MTSSCEADRRVQASGHQQASTPRMCFPWWTMPVGARTLRCVGSCFQNSSDVDVVTIKVRVLPPRGRLLTSSSLSMSTLETLNAKGTGDARLPSCAPRAACV